MTKPYKTIYHVFADNLDDWFDTYAQALAAFKKLKADGYLDIRLYEEVYETKEAYEDTMDCDENCLLAVGSFPM